ncbi:MULTISPECIES: cytochrome b6-f complex subunit PetL [Nostoc]|jgi:cytochrome b6-f complex subunit 6|uniref:Cytochrome b6-f complex subunit 6 n=3 Tax=Nostoc TaxID=1177 RepID=A0ABR8I2H7_9NOSO|nr:MULTISPECIES: cytochrome b6-f complex subunit PetL [Nostoc]MBW4424197.1 cytochrome b6-f complex subunit PetL [Nostoc desertorum CM1-VF14]MCC5648263.1 cytochrome b6-f complex subunit PetL [Nostoc sp. XA013]MBD2247127.1 cytochrome b6-f complex subunit PetL [Nostoc sp. FACHB-888]MBD2559942.1 cytochrome b6-f complex subunit PetL [Nostoc linckia FACHB-391]MBD2645094.1 cytochrome b6-f complex subunit PetL [Nostoc foliaceum FACHB-393]
MFAIVAYIGFLALFFGLAVGLLFGLRTAKII